MKDILAYLDKNRERHIEELKAFLSFPSVSTAPKYEADVKNAAEWVAQQLRDVGCEDVEIRRTKGHPIVYGRTPTVAGKETALVYGHYDVQPAEPFELWESPPFKPDIRRGRIYARGAADDKGQVFLYLKVLEAFRAVRGALPINVKLLIEGEEEIGSPNLVPFVRSNRRQLRADAVVVSDTHMVGATIPSITVGLRGISSFEVSVTTAKTDLHSGTYGGGIANPIQVLVDLLAQCKDPKTAKVLIPGFYDDVSELSDADRQEFSRVPHNDKKFARDVGALALFGEEGYSTLERVGIRPTFEINGILGGYTGAGIKTVLPATATAKVTMRLVKDQQPDRIARAFQRFVEGNAPPHATVKVRELENAGWPTRVDANDKYVLMAKDALRRVFRKDAVLSMEGGSIPIVEQFTRLLKCPAVLLGFSLPDDRPHAPNEKFDLKMLDKGMRTIAHLFEAWGND